MNFPETVLPIVAEMYINGTWVNITSDVLGADADRSIEIHRGSDDGQSGLQTATANLVLKNTGGKYSPRNINSVYYPYLVKNTPVRIYLLPTWTVGSHMDDTDTFTRTVAAGWGSSNGGNAYTVWYLVDGSYSTTDLSVGSGVGTISIPVAGSWRAAILAGLNMADVDVYATCTCNVTNVSGGAIEPINIIIRADSSLSAYYLFRVEVATDEIISAIILYSDGTTLGGAQIDSFTYSGQALRTRVRAIGDELSFKVWEASGSEPTEWTVTITDIRKLESGSVGFRSGIASGNTNTKPITHAWDSVSITYILTRFVGELEEWPVKFDATGTDLRTPITVTSIDSRLNQGNKTPRSPLERFIRDNDPTAYWSLDDGAQADIGGSVTPGQPGYENVGAMTFSSVAGPVGAPASLPEMVQDTALGEPALTVTLVEDTGTSWTLDLVLRLTAPPGATSWSYTVFNALDRNNNVWIMQIFGDTGTSTYTMEVQTFTPTVSAIITVTTAINLVDSYWHSIRIQCTEVTASSLLLETYIDDGEYNNGSGSVPPAGLYSVSIMNSSKTYMGSASVGHIAIFPGASVIPSAYSAFQGYPGETIDTRIARLSSQDGVSVIQRTGNTDPPTLMAQRTAPLTELLADIRTADQGLLYPTRNARAFTYRELGAIYNRVAYDLSYSSSQITFSEEFRPYYDAQYLWNDVTVVRYQGSRYRSEQITGVNNTANPPTGVGTYDRGEYTTHVSSDTKLPEVADWIRTVGVCDSARWPMIPWWVERTSVITDQPNTSYVAELDIGDVIRLVDLPDFLEQGDYRGLIIGYNELLSNFQWHIDWITRPADPYYVGTVDGVERVCADGDMVLSVAATANATDLYVFSTSGTQRWCHDDDDSDSPDDYPMEIIVGGELMSATDCAYAAYDLFARTSASTWNNTTSGHTWSTSGSASTFSVADPYASILPGSNNTDIRAFFSADGGADREIRVKWKIPALTYTSSFNAGIIGRRLDDNNFYYAYAQVNTSGGASLIISKRVAGSATTLATYSVPWTITAGSIWNTKFRLVGTSLKAKVWSNNGGEPDWQATATDSSLASGTTSGLYARNNGTTVVAQVDFADYEVSSPQKLTVTRTSRAIAHVAGTDVDVQFPVVVGLEG